MSRSAAVSVIVWFAALVGGAHTGWAQEPPADQATPRRAVAAPEILQRSPSSVYYAFKAMTDAHETPDPASPVVFTISSESQSLKALGLVPERAAEGQASRGPWIKLKPSTGSAGFVELSELITPQQLEAKKQSIKKLAMFEAELDAMRRSSSAAIPSGIYTLGGRCDAGFDSNVDTIAFLNNKVLVWQDGPKLHFVHVLDPLAPIVYAMQNDGRTVELQGFGYIQMKVFQSDQDTALIGYKSKLLWFSASGTQFDNYQLCDAATDDTVLSLLRAYAHQRPPEEVRGNPKGQAQ